MQNELQSYISKITPKLREIRHNLHKHAEYGWTEFWTTAYIADLLEDAGYHITIGPENFVADERMGLPSLIELDEAAERALSWGANPKHVDKMRGGFTGLVADLRPAPCAKIALRFDIDANTLQECLEPDHKPVEDGFASVNQGACHACGHDGNATIGLGVAFAVAAFKDRVKENVRFIFQPAEEGVRGALPMVKAGVVDGVKAFVGCHVGFKAFKDKGLILGGGKFLATSKFDAYFTGVSSHAGAYPQDGNNSLLAASTTALNLHAIPRHSDGATRVTLGRLEAGEGRNIIPANAHLVVETRGETTDLNDYMFSKAHQVIKHSALMYDQDYQIKMMGGCKSGESDIKMIALLKNAALQVAYYEEELIEEYAEFGGSDDVTEFMDAVQRQGGIASYCMAGTTLAAGHHHYRFDFNEACLAPAAEFLTLSVFAMCDLGLGEQ